MIEFVTYKWTRGDLQKGAWYQIFLLCASYAHRPQGQRSEQVHKLFCGNKQCKLLKILNYDYYKTTSKVVVELGASKHLHQLRLHQQSA